MDNRTPAAARRATLPPMPPARHWRRWVGAPVLLLVLAMWLALFAAGLMADAGRAKGLLALGLGTLAGMLVILGHDASHGSLTPWPRANALLARLAFVPAWQSETGWAQAHRQHHAWTNLAGRDAGYPPPSPEQWRAMGPVRRLSLRCVYSLPGLWLLYGQVWWRHVIRPQPGHRRWWADSLLVLAFAAVQLAAVALWGRWHGPAALGEAALLVLLPFGVTLWFVSAITLQHHRHPALHWYDEPAAWQAARHREPDTVQLELPPWAASLLLRIFDHAAHHTDPRRPFAALPPAQRALQRLQPAPVVVVHEPQPWRLQALRRVLRECQLYDYRERRWLRFSEVPVPGAPRPASPAPTAPRTGRTAAP